MSAPVFLAEPGALDRLGSGDSYLLAGPEGRHAAVVQRRAVGELIEVVDGRGVRLRGEITAVAADGVQLAVTERVDEPRPSVEIVLVQALAKGDRDEAAIEAATELGVDAIVPWQADRCVVRWRGERADKGRLRWEATVRAATKQSRRASVPDVGRVLDSAGVARLVRDTVATRGAALVLHEAAPAPWRTVAFPTEQGRILVVVGPEGGISPAELEAFDAAGASPVLLGPHVLRTSTAGPVAVAMIAERLGRWTSGRRLS